MTTVPARDGVKHNPSGLCKDTSSALVQHCRGERVPVQNCCAAPLVLPGSSRRSWFGQTLSLGVAACLGQWAVPAPAQTSAQTPQHTSGAGMLTRPIPSTGELLPAVGLGSWITFNVGNDSVARDACTEVVRAFFAGGGRLIDSSPMYGSSQPTIGYALAKLGQPKALFSAEKVWIGDAGQGVAQLDASRTFWGVPRFDLVQVHNLLAWREHLPRLLALKAAGQLRYVGITTSEGRRHGDIEQVMRTQPIDFVQLSYNLLDREAETRLLPLAQERGIAVIVNRPFREGALLAQLRRHRLPGWAMELGCDGWAQAALKFIVSHPAVTCAIPATSQVAHVRQNLGAMRGPIQRWPLDGRLGGLGLAGATGFAAWAFVWQRYVPINWGAQAMAVALALEAVLVLVLVLVLGVIAQPCSALEPSYTLSPLRWRVGLGLIVGAAVLYPGIALIAGRPWTQGEWVGVAVDPTVLALLGWLLCAVPLTRLARIGWWATALTALALGLASAATLATMGAMEAWPLSVALLLILMTLRRL